MIGILVHGDNHFIVRGPLPDRDVALALVRHWSLIQIGATTPRALDRWHIVSREFRENLRWAVVVPGANDIAAFNYWASRYWRFRKEAELSRSVIVR